MPRVLEGVTGRKTYQTKRAMLNCSPSNKQQVMCIDLL